LKLSLLVIDRYTLLFFFGGLMSAGAQALPKPEGAVILTISGQISQHNVGEFAQFDAEMIDKLAK
jgi:hypothetical protein